MRKDFRRYFREVFYCNAEVEEQRTISQPKFLLEYTKVWNLREVLNLNLLIYAFMISMQKSSLRVTYKLRIGIIYVNLPYN